MGANKLIAIAIFFKLSVLYALGQQMEWYKETWRPYYQSMSALSNDANGYVSFAGLYLQKDASVGGVTLNSTGGCAFNIFVCQYNSEGDLLWANTSDFPINCSGAFLNDGWMDTERSVVIIGDFFGDIAFDTFQLSASPNRAEVFVAKYNAKGSLLWAQSIGGEGNDYGRYVKTDGSNNIYIAGEFDYPFRICGQTFDGVNVTDGADNNYLAKLDANGALVWIKFFRFNFYPLFDVSPNGDVIVTGEFQHYLEIDSLHIPAGSPQSSEQFIARLNPDGTTNWVKTIICPNTQKPEGIVFDAKLNSYVLSFWHGDFIEIEGNHIPLNEHAVKIMKLDSAGKYLWHKEFLGDTSTCTFYYQYLTLHPSGEPCLFCEETEIFDPLYHHYGMVWARFDTADGNIKLVNRFDPNFHSGGYDTGFDRYGAMYLYGGSLDGILFQGTPIPPPTEGVYFFKIMGDSVPQQNQNLIFPNPASDNVTINISGDPSDMLEVFIYQVDGRLIYHKMITGNDLEGLSIDVSHWAESLYVGSIRSIENFDSFKLIIKR